VAVRGLRLLVDAHVLIWLATEPERVPGRIVAAIAEETNEKLVSAVTAFEIEVKRLAGRLPVPRRLVSALLDAGYIELPLHFAHSIEAARLPRIHRDPFDRMLVGQARVEGLTIVSADKRIRRYDVPVLAAA
jgi:PIN domain nuclease of toxin-antitoxin system